MSRHRFARPRLTALGAMLLASVIFVTTPRTSAAQSRDQIYTPEDLTEMPRLVSPSYVRHLITQAFPEALRRAGTDGIVQIEMVVGADGKVEPGSVQVVASTNDALSDAAKTVAPKIEFRPGRVKNTAVRARVVLPLIFQR